MEASISHEHKQTYEAKYKARLAGHEIRKKGLQTDIFSKHLKDTVVLEGDILIQFGTNIIEEENQLTK